MLDKEKDSDLYKISWRKCLESHGINTDFTRSSYVDIVRPEENGLGLRVFRTNPSFINRRKIMRDLKVCSCLLCSALLTDQEKRRTIEETENYVLIPNKYPALEGTSLIVSKEHKLLELDYSPKESKDYLTEILNFCKKYRLLAIRNHPRAGMSIPDHEHTHLMPQFLERDINLFAFSESSFKEFEGRKGVFCLSGTVFDTLAFNSENLEYAQRIIQGLVRKRITFSLSCGDFGGEKFYFTITPHKMQDEKNEISGGSTSYHKHTLEGERVDYNAHLKNIEKYVYTRGEFNWAEYII